MSVQNQTAEKEVLLKISEITMRDVDDIQMDMSLADDLGIDSLSIANLISKFEARVMAHPSMTQYVKLLSNAQTVRQFCDLINNQDIK
jgi:acyl carrier protein